MKKKLLFLFLIFSSLLYAQDGTLDMSFGVNGISTINDLYIGENYAQPLFTPNNKILVQTWLEINASEMEYAISRINEDGSLDNTFGHNGSFLTTDLLISDQNVIESSVVGGDPYRKIDSYDVQSDGKILVLLREIDRFPDPNNSENPLQSAKLFLYRLNQNGTLDTSFGSNGFKIIFSMQNIEIEFEKNLISDFKIKVLANDCFIVSGSYYEKIEFWKYNSDGTSFTDFGTNGNTKTEIRAKTRKILIDDDSNIYLLANGEVFLDFNYYIIKLKNNGVIDQDFANQGVFSSISQGIKKWAFGFDILSNNNLVIGANWRVISTGQTGISIKNIDSHGVSDADFGVNGEKNIEAELSFYYYQNDLHTMPNDNIIFGGTFFNPETTRDFDLSLGVFKLFKNGDFDSSFGTNGIALTPLPDDSNIVFGLFVKPDDYNVLVLNSTIDIFATPSLTTNIFCIQNSLTWSSLRVNGDVSGLWNADTVYVDGDIIVPVNESLKINPGTNVYFKGEYKFDVYGQLLANGTPTDSITFEADSLGYDYSAQYYTRVGHWFGMGFNDIDVNQSPKSELSYCNFKYALTKADHTYEPDYNNDSVGAPIRLYNSSNVSIDHIHISECDAYYFGSIHMVNSSPSLSHITITNTTEAIQMRAGSDAMLKDITLSDSYILIVDSDPIIENLLVEDRYGMSLIGRNFGGQVKNSVFRNNTYGWENGGGAIKLYGGGDALFENVLFEGNSQIYSDGWHGHGGAAYMQDAEPTFRNCEFIGNSAYGSGGAIALGSNDYSKHWTSTFENCLFVKNTVTVDAGTITTGTNTSVYLLNCTLADNTAPYAAAIKNDSGSPNEFINTIIYNNGPNLDQQFTTHWSNHSLSYNIIQGEYYGKDESSTNIHNVDPLFRDPANNDYHLQGINCGYNEDSPAIDAGDPEIGDFVVECASAGLGSGRSDIGAYGGNNNWWDKSITPSCYYRGEVSGVWDCEEITIIGDILVPAGDTLEITEAVEWVLIKGPYQIKVEGVLLARGPENESTTLGSDLIKFQGDKWHGIFFNNLNDGNEGTSIISNCRFDYADKMNMPYQGGGAISIYNSDNVSIRNSVFYANNAVFGGAMYIENSDIEIDDCLFQWNGKERGQTGTALTTAGGAIYIKNANPKMHKLRFADNHSVQGGGAMVFDNASPSLSNILMATNVTAGLGGGIQCINGASPTFSNLTSADNVAGMSGGSFHFNNNSSSTVINSILYGNSKPEIYAEGTVPNVSYTIVDEGSSENFFGEGCLVDNPYFAAGVEYKLANNTCSYSDGNTVVSPAIDAGHPDSLDVILDCDNGLGTQRADMGYYGGGLSTIHVGLTELNKNETFIIYPNPTPNSVTLGLSMENSGEFRYSVYNLFGQMLEESNMLRTNSIKIDLTDYKAGIYFIKVEIEDEVYMRQVIKQ